VGKGAAVRLLGGCAVAIGVFVAGSGVGLAAGKSGSVTVYAGPPLQKPPAGISPHADALFFFPRSVTITVGQTVTWQLFGFHTVTFAGSHHPYPFATPAGKQGVTKDAASQPFWWSGKAPVLAISPLAILPMCVVRA
jgi:plastocyanin